jgi:hypothetical protein
MAGKKIYTVGDKIGNFAFFADADALPPHNTRMVYVKCLCGKIVLRRLHNIQTNTKSCGCRAHLIGKPKKTGCSEYNSWCGIIQRCTNPNNESYKHYGGRGISVCDRWRYSYDNFLSDMGKKPGKGYSLDRKEVNGNYEPGNCRWATKKQQADNKRTTVYIVLNNEKLNLSDWSKKTGLSRSLIGMRIRRGMTPEKILANTRYGRQRANKVSLVVNWQ